jgi:AcrR family transcriptional regulator
LSAVPTRRRADAARNDELFLDTGLDLLRERGPDRFAALELARTAGLTTGAVYARYENPAEILVGLWQNRIATPMEMFVANSLEALSISDRRDAAHAATSRALTNPSGPLRPGASVLIAATRVPELAEVVGPDMRRWCDELGIGADSSDPSVARQRILLAVVMGVLLFDTADLYDAEDWAFARRVAEAMHAEPNVGRIPLPDPVAPGEPIVHTENEMRDALVNGAARVIAHGGIERATTQRIARAAGVPPSTLFAEYRTRPELFADVASKLLGAIYSGARAVEPSRAGSETWQERLLTSRLATYRGLLQPSASDQRRLRLEFHLAALHDPMIGQALRRVDTDVNRQVSHAWATNAELDPATLLRTTRLIRSSGLGAMLLQELVGGYDRLDLRQMFEPLIALLENSRIAA